MRPVGMLAAGNADASAAYARRLTGEVRHRFGYSRTPHLATLTLQSQELTEVLSKQQWKRAAELLSAGCKHLIQLGSEAVLTCSSRLQPAAELLNPGVPLLPMTEAVGAALQTLGLRRIGLVGAFSDSEETHWRKRLARFQVLDTFVPVRRDREHLAHMAVEELQQGVVNPSTRADVGRIVYSLRQAGARAIVLVAPELTLALSHLDPVLPVLDAEELHALFALEWSLRTPPASPTPTSRTRSREKRPIKSATTLA